MYVRDVKIPRRVYESLKQVAEKHIKALGVKPKLILIGNQKLEIGGDK